MKKLTVALIPLVFCFASAIEATPIVTFATLTGANEFPPNSSPGRGEAVVTYDPDLHTLGIDVSFSGLIGTTTAAHIHCCVAVPLDETLTAGVATQTPSFVGFPLGVMSGTYSNVFDLTLASSWNASFITASGGIMQAEARLAEALELGTAYFNIHTTFAPGGEIRGFLLPEPGTLSFLAFGLSALAAFTRKRR